MGSRRTHEEAAVAAARAAYVAGFAATSNLAARQRLRRPDGRHQRALLHPAARHRARRLPRPGRRRSGAGTTLLVDTYDIAEAVRLGGRGRRARARRGAASTPATSACSPTRCAPSSTRSARPDTRIVVTSDLDEYAIAALAAAPVDGYGVGTSLVTGSGHPTCGFVYKLVAREDADGEMVGVAKKSKDKISIGGRKYALRRRDADGVAEAEVVGIGAAAGRRRRRPAAAGAAGPRRRGRRPRAAGRRPASGTCAPAPSCRCIARMLSRGEPVIPTIHV